MNNGTHGRVDVLDRHGDRLHSFPLNADDSIRPEDWSECFSIFAGYDIEPSRLGARIPDGCEDLSIAVYVNAERNREHMTLWSRVNFMIIPA